MTSLVIPREHNILEISGLSCSICMTISFSSLYSQDFSSLFYEFSLSLSLSLSSLLGKKRWNGCFDTCLFLPPTRFVSHTRIRVVEKQKLKGHRYGIRKIVWKSLVEKHWKKEYSAIFILTLEKVGRKFGEVQRIIGE